MDWIRSIWNKTLVFLEMIKWEHSVFALPFAYLGLFLAERGLPPVPLIFKITLAMVAFRTMAMGLNRILDAGIDAKNPRTSSRALPSKKLKLSFVWLLTVVMFFLFEVSAYWLSPLCFYLSPVPVFLALLYPLMKRFTWCSHFILGIILGIAPYGAWIASRGGFSWIPGFLTLGITCWVAGFDIIYSLQDVEFDRQEGLYSFPSRFGVPASLKMTAWLHLVTLLFWSAAGTLAGLGWIYWGGMAAGALFLLREHWLIRTCGIKMIQEAFFSMNALISFSVFVMTLLDLSVRRTF
ncbi:MAG: hypothetical protein A2Z83_03435 [Omnitrophica bacterium GWA2_52_8]|nr:MAG: hypothetical protein A2Z83_03435 [Omnitrophica bacterium GWA2_52_8]